MAKRYRKQNAKRIKNKKKLIVSATGQDFDSINALTVAVSLKKRKRKGDRLMSIYSSSSLATIDPSKTLDSKLCKRALQVADEILAIGNGKI